MNDDARWLDLGNGEAYAIGTAEDMAAAAEYLREHYPDGPTEPRAGPAIGPVVNMGHDLYRMLRASILPELSPLEQAVALVLADICADKTQKPPLNMNVSKRVCDDLGISQGTLGNILAKLAGRGLELRVPIAKDKRGRPVYAAKGHSVDYHFPVLPPRDPKGPLSDGPLESEPVDNRPAPPPEGPLGSGPSDAKVHSLANKGPLPSGPLPPKRPQRKDDPEISVPVSQPDVEGSSAASGQDPDIGGNGNRSPRTAEETAAEFLRQADGLRVWMDAHPEAVSADEGAA